MFAVIGRGAKSNEEAREVVAKTFCGHIQPSMKYATPYKLFLLYLFNG